mmetsp:Transcript_3328/g.11849  ORF Transcript_3328/g.11849 Transcript_3328/m.11849 type:complete len:237 (+) Transcript_3328:1086-1796(+)
MHLLSSDLNFERENLFVLFVFHETFVRALEIGIVHISSFYRQYRGMQRSVRVQFGCRDVVFHTSRDRWIQSVDQPKNVVRYSNRVGSLRGLAQSFRRHIVEQDDANLRNFVHVRYSRLEISQFLFLFLVYVVFVFLFDGTIFFFVVNKTWLFLALQRLTIYAIIFLNVFIDCKAYHGAAQKIVVFQCFVQFSGNVINNWQVNALELLFSLRDCLVTSRTGPPKRNLLQLVFHIVHS